MGSIKGLLLLICTAGIVGSGRIAGGIVKKEDYESIVEIARREIGVREEGCGNCGPRVGTYLNYVGFQKAAPWCAAFVSYCFGRAGYPQPRTAWSPALFPASRVVSPRTAVGSSGLVYGIYYAALGRIGHCGIVETWRGDWCSGIEGNTNGLGSRDGEGVYRKIRHKRTIAKFSDWVGK